MNTFHKTVVTGSLFFIGLGVPATAIAASGCNNGYLLGHYNAQSSNANVVNLLALLAASDGSTPAKIPAGFVNNPSSLAGQTAALGRYYLDGAGNILGTATAGNPFLGTYSVSSDCTAKLTFKSGRTFNAVVAGQGLDVFYVGTDANGIGVTGKLQRSANYCINSNSSQSFAFQYYGAVQNTTSVQPYAAIGTLVTDGAGNFSINEWISTGKSAQQLIGGGTYSISTNCSVSLTFKGAAATNSLRPASVSFLIPQYSNDNTGLIEVEPATGQVLTGTVIAQ
jgi:hypothetical protein